MIMTSIGQSSSSSKRPTRRWSQDEHARFLRGLEMFPHGPWSRIAALVGTRTTRQTLTHAQKYRERMTRRANEVHAMWDARGQSTMSANFAMLEETVRELPAFEAMNTQPCSSDEDFMDETGVGGMAGDMDELDLRILMSLLTPEIDEHTMPSQINMESFSTAESYQLDHTIWSLLVDVPGDLTQFPDDQ